MKSKKTTSFRGKKRLVIFIFIGVNSFSLKGKADSMFE